MGNDWLVWFLNYFRYGNRGKKFAPSGNCTPPTLVIEPFQHMFKGTHITYLCHLIYELNLSNYNIFVKA
jgi:hypothetical protein